MKRNIEKERLHLSTFQVLPSHHFSRAFPLPSLPDFLTNRALAEGPSFLLQVLVPVLQCKFQA